MAHKPFQRNLVFLLCICAGIVFGAGVYTFHYAKGTSYLSNNPKACINCHVMQENYDSWVKSSHHAVATCNDCHVSHKLPQKYIDKARNGWNHSKAFTLQNFEEPIRIKDEDRKIVEKNCLHCHEVVVSRITDHDAVKKGKMSCTVCHRSVGHMEF